jgi:hypothetical protein
VLSSRSAADVSPEVVDAGVRDLEALLQHHGLAVDFWRLGPCLYSVAGRKLHVRAVHGQLLLRIGAGYEDAMEAIGKMRASASGAPCQALDRP